MDYLSLPDRAILRRFSAATWWTQQKKNDRALAEVCTVQVLF